MQANKDQGMWARVKGRIKWVLKEFREDSVAANPQKPVDCCNPVIPEKNKEKN